MQRAVVVATRSVAASLIALLTTTAACTDKKLVPVSDGAPQAVDDLLEVDADFCTTPAADVAFPVKLVLVIDASGSMQFTDQPGLRVNAIEQLINALQSQANVSVSTIAFGSNIYQQPTPTATNPSVFEPVAGWQPPPFLSLKDVTTDYQGVLAAINQTLLLDMTNTAPDVLARTKYVILFFSDGAPNPLCCIQADATVGTMQFPFGCQPESWETPDPNTIYCEGLAENNICLQSAALTNFQQNLNGVLNQQAGQNLPAGYDVTQNLPDYGSGVVSAVSQLKVDANYNRTFQIEQGVRDIVKLGEDFHVGNLTFNTALLDDPSLGDVVKQTFELNSCRERGLLQDMANIGHGQFRDFSNSQSIDFLSFDFTSLKEEFTLIGAYAINQNALPPGGDPKVLDYRPDSDGDGLDDDTEFAIGTIANLKDSDSQEVQTQVGQLPKVCDYSNGIPGVYPDGTSCSDGFDDGFEHAREDIGFDPRLTSLPVQACPVTAQNEIDQSDRDGDGLNGCEEAILGTDPNNPDTDGDSLPDGLEVRLGLDPLIAEGNRDDDFDGTPNLEEVRKGRDPSIPDSIREQTSVRYELIETGHTEDGRTCYTEKARGVHLATTVPRNGFNNSGYNDVLFFIAEAPNGSTANRNVIRVACARAQYIKPSFKNPIEGVIHLKESDFVYLQLPSGITDQQDLVTLTNFGDPTSGFDLCHFDGHPDGLEVK